MEVKWIGTPNFATGRKGYKPLAIINHIMEGTLAGTDDWFGKTESQVSSHYGIGRNGEVHQYVKEEDTAWANGRKLEPNQAWLANFPADVNPNLWTISIEHEGYPDQPLTPEQTAATIELQRYLCAKWDIPVDDVHITGHFRIDSQWKADCPGPHFPWDAIYSALTPAPVVEEETKVSEYTPIPVPDWAKATIDKLVAKGKLTDPTGDYSFYRVLVILDRFGLFDK
jgi:N-acetyl-anhydromuramyl-L-alanine amidase AmpD